MRKHLLLNPRVKDRKDDFDPVIEVAPHHVGAAQVDALIRRRVLEVENAAVFQKAPDNADHADILAQAGDTGAQAADPAHQQIDLHARLRRLVQLLDDQVFFKLVHLEDQAGGFACARGRDLVVDQRDQAVHADIPARPADADIRSPARSPSGG